MKYYKSTVRTYYCLIILSVFSYGSFAQNISDSLNISNRLEGIPLIVFLDSVEQVTHLRLFYDIDSLPDIQVSFPDNSKNIVSILEYNLSEYDYKISSDNFGNVFVLKDKTIRTSIPDSFYEYINVTSDEIRPYDELDKKPDYLKTVSTAVKKTVIIGSKAKGGSGKTAVIAGYLKDRETGKPIMGGTILVKELGIGTASNILGYYVIKVPKGNYTMIASSIDMKEETVLVKVLSDGYLDFDMEKKIMALDEVVIVADKFHNVKSIHTGFERLTTKEMKEIPMIMGERDIVKVALLLPGVLNVGEGSSGFNVRGGQADQNLFRISNMPVYNTSHLFGFFSAFNSDAISGFELYKSSIPAQFGGRISSVFDIQTKEGNYKKFSFKGGVSPITGRILFEGPIQKDKSSYMIGLRSTYSNWILRYIEDPAIRDSRFWFGDAIARLNFSFKEKHKLALFGYSSYDKINLEKTTHHEYANIGSSIIWEQVLRRKHELRFSLAYSGYFFEEDNNYIETQAYKHAYDIRHTEAQAEIILNPNNKHTLRSGFNGILYSLDGGRHEPLTSESAISPVFLDREQAIESAFYISEEWKIISFLTTSLGTRLNYYTYLGPKNIYIYQAGIPKRENTIYDSLSFGTNERVKEYLKPDIRFSLNYQIRPTLALKLSYNQLQQYIFMLSNTIAIAPTDKWKLADYHIKPMEGVQYSVGLYKNFLNNKIEASIEGYLKNTKNILEYRDGANLLVSELPETDVIQGDQRANGIEFMLKKNFGRLTGWVSYTYSRAKTKVHNYKTGESINSGQEFPSNFDKPHALNMVGVYKFTRRFSLSANLVYSTGRPITYPTAIYHQHDIEILNYSLRNEYRLPYYFRIDMSLNIEGNLVSKKFVHGSWMFSIYNLTGRKNAYSVYFTNEEGQIKGYRMSIYGSPIFTVTYSFKLGNYAN